MIYLLDTDILIFLMRGLKAVRRPRQRSQAETVVEKCQEAMADGDRAGISAVTLSELEYGAWRSGQYETEIDAVHKVLVPFEFFDYDAIHCVANYGKVRHALELRGAQIGGMDTMIAAHALALQATLVTNNTVHFSRVSGLTVVNWLESC